MMKEKIYIVILATMLWMATGCTPVGSSSRSSMPREYHSAYLQSHGRCYDYTPYNVFSLDLYAGDLNLNEEKNMMEGTGYNLFLSDIFLTGNTLETGTYTAIPVDSLSSPTYQIPPFSFLPGRDYEGTPHGIYLLYMEESKLKDIQVLDSGTLVVRDTTNAMLDLQFTLYFQNSYGGRATYRSHFQGVLTPAP